MEHMFTLFFKDYDHTNFYLCILENNILLIVNMMFIKKHPYEHLIGYN